MAEETDPQINALYETLVQNAQSGRVFHITFKDDPVVYTGVAIMSMGFTAEEGMFDFRILEPKDQRALVRRSIREIETLTPA